MKLVIVESPAKARTISGFLGSGYTVKASMGHIRDLPKTGLGIDKEHGFMPEYIISPEKTAVVRELTADAKRADELILATDEDREGEAISWHLLAALKVDPAKKRVQRIVFHEITKGAVEEALRHPREIDGHLVDAQQARRVLDRLVGYELSPLLWKKVKAGLSAGRVQSVAVRLVVDREREIRAFVPEEYWTITALLKTPRGDRFEAELSKIGKDKAVVRTGAEAEKVQLGTKGQPFTVTSVETKEVARNPAAPFTTSTLQQEASRKLGFTVKKTMMVAQKLYEGAYGEGLITYMRTDSMHLAGTAIAAARRFIESEYGAEYVPLSPRQYKTKAKGAQEAHEAIRPTDMFRRPESLRGVDADAMKLYALIWQRTLACQMASARIAQTGADIVASIYTFRATGQQILFPGFLRVYEEGRDDVVDDGEKRLPELREGETEELERMLTEQHFTKPPARYTEATLVKKLEAEGIGRPSTYAPTISTVQDRGYIEKEGKALKPTDTGEVVTDFLVAHFAKIVDFAFTARMEEAFDEIAEGKKQWQSVLTDFYGDFSALLGKGQEVSRQEANQSRLLGVDPRSGKNVYARLGRFGAMVQCGESEDEEKPKFASLGKGQSIALVTLEEALKLLELPRTLGESDGEVVKANRGRFGPYVQLGTTYASITEEEIYTISLQDALLRIAEKREAAAKRIMQEFGGGVSVLNGKFGPYITDGKKNAKIPKDMKPEDLTEEQCVTLLAEAPEKKAWGRKKAAGGKKVVAKKTVTKKVAVKKTAVKKVATRKKKEA